MEILTVLLLIALIGLVLFAISKVTSSGRFDEKIGRASCRERV